MARAGRYDQRVRRMDRQTNARAEATMRAARSIIAAATTTAVVLAAISVASVPAGASPDTTWTITPTVYDQTANGASNCSPPGGPHASGTSCIFTYGTPAVSSHGEWVTEPWSVLATAWGSEWNGGNTWQYTAPDHFWGADAFVGYTMPDGSKYRITVTDDVNEQTDAPYLSGASCGMNPSQLSAYVCTPVGGKNSGNYPDVADYKPSFIFQPRGSEQSVSAGETCSGTIATGATYPCTGNGVGAFPAETTIVVHNTGSVGVGIFDGDGPTSYIETIAGGGSGTIVFEQGDQLFIGNAGGTTATVSIDLPAVTMFGAGQGPASGSWQNGLKSAFWTWLLSGDEDSGEAWIHRASTLPPQDVLDLWTRIHLTDTTSTSTSTSSSTTSTTSTTAPPDTVASSSADPAQPVAATPAFTG